MVAIDGKTQACSEKTYLCTCGRYHDYIDNNAIGACVKNAIVRTTPLHHCGTSYEMDGDPLGLSDNVLEIYK